jgi:two-component system, cell cycle sensor histidine kinase and response regulator CckA
MSTAGLKRSRTRTRLLPYVWAAIATIVATLLRMALAPLLGNSAPFALYFVGILLAAWYGGFLSGVVAILLAAVAGTYFFISPATTSPFVLSTHADRVTLFGFVLLSLVGVLLLALQKRTLDRMKQEAIHRKAAEDAEREQRQWFETTLASIGDAVIVADGDGKVTFMNQIASELTGWSLAEARGLALRTVFQIVNELTGKEAVSPIDTAMKEGSIVGLANHTLLLARDGRRIPLDDSGAPIKQQGHTMGAVLVFRDVTERRRAQRLVEHSEKRYRLLFENNPQPMWVYDRDTLAFLAVNNAAVKQYGYTAAEFLQMTLRDIQPAGEVPALLADGDPKSATPHRDGPWHHRKRDGTIIDVEITAHPIDLEGRNASLVLATDITERQHLQEQLYQAQRLESIGRLAGGVAHDFNNLLTVINGYAAVALSELPATSPIRPRIGEIAAAGRQAAALTEQLLAFSRRQVVQPTVLNLNSVIREMDSMLRRLIGEDIELVVKPSADLSNVRADASQLQQVIVNLAVNARDAMPQGGSLIIETTNALLDENYCAKHSEVRPGVYVALAVSDTGSGMTPEVQHHIFEPFFTTKPRGVGTGLGLAMVHGTVRQSSGHIWVYSEPGSGTTFKIYLPGTGELASQREVAVQTDLSGSETILVVEDQPEVRRLAVTVLEQYGYRVLHAAGGEEAIAVAREFAGAIHLLLTDIVMPGMKGPALAEQLASNRAIRILFMSGYTENAIAHRGILGAGSDYIQKPFTPESLAKKVREVLELREGRQESSSPGA